MTEIISVQCNPHGGQLWRANDCALKIHRKAYIMQIYEVSQFHLSYAMSERASRP